MSRLHVVRAMISAAAAMFWMWPCSAPSVNDTDHVSSSALEKAPRYTRRSLAVARASIASSPWSPPDSAIDG